MPRPRAVFSTSSYFRVKDEGKFREWAKSIEDLEVVTDEEGRVGLLSREEKGRWPYCIYDEETGEAEDIDLFQDVADRLQEGSVAVFFEAGAESLRYLTGWALAINSQEQTVKINLDDIYALAELLGDEITLAWF
jgi:hypothetical protein